MSKKDDFLNDFADILEVEPAELSDAFAFTKDNWNSLAIVSTIVLIDEHFGVAVAGDKLVDSTSVGILFKHIEEAGADLT
jgi:acyl carrier protein